MVLKEEKVDAIILTGGMAYDEYFIKTLKRVYIFYRKSCNYSRRRRNASFIKWVLRVLNGEEKSTRIYRSTSKIEICQKNKKKCKLNNYFCRRYCK